ncbi:MAG: glycosyl transferase family 2 [Chlamydiae bacterium]|nr:MAG: glycosyl transferase family 2 [Chlamydiota bacterium]
MIIFSIIIPAYNEEHFLSQTLISAKEAIKKVESAGEIIVVDNNSTDRTAEIARNFGVKVIFEEYNQIAKARNSGAQVAKGEYLIFLDADTILSPELLSIALKNLSSGKCCGGGCKIKMDKELSFTSQKLLNFWNWISEKKSLAAGCFIYCSRKGFEGTGGFNEKIYASEEIWFSKNLRKWGKKQNLEFKIINDISIVTSGRKLDNKFKLWRSMLAILFFPFSIFFRRMCSYWYKK